MKLQNHFFATIALMFVITISKAQSVPNGNFENWSNPNGYLVPDNWETLNDMTSSASVYTATRGGTTSNYYLKLTTQNVSGMGVMPGVAASGILDMTSFSPLSGFPYALRPTSITGKWQYMGNSSNDVGVIAVYLTKWNTGMNMRDTIGYSIQNLTGMVMSWANYSLPFTYNSSDNPDSCMIYLNASGNNPEAGSYLYVDNLSFSGVVLGVENTEITGTFNVFPNPSNDLIKIDLSGLKSTAEQFEVLDIAGRVVATQKSNGALLQTISVSEITAGSYVLKIHTAKGIVTRKITKQ